MAETITYEVDGRVATVTLQRPEKLNAITRQLQVELLAALAEAEADPNVHVAVVAGAGRGFSAGYDLAGGNAHGGGVTGDRDWLEQVLHGWLAIWDLRLPVIAKVHGVCLAGGTQLAASFWTWFVGPKKAKEIFFPTGTMISGTEAAEIGLFNRAFPADTIDDAVAAYAARVARTPKDILALQKQSINRTQELAGFRAALLQGAEIDAIAHGSPSVRAVNKFIAQHGLSEALRAFQAGELL